MKSVNSTGKTIIVLYLLLNIFVVLANMINPVFGATLLEEDRTVENITALALLLAAFYMAYQAFRNIQTKNYFMGLMQLLLMLVFIFMGGEEISWGQRIFNWQTTGFFKADNLQNETNFHNLKIDGVKLNKVIFTYAFMVIGGFVFLIAPFLYKKQAGFRNFINKFGATLPRYIHTLFLIIGLLFVLLISNSRKWELWECNAAIIILWMVMQPLNKDVIYPGNTLNRS